MKLAEVVGEYVTHKRSMGMRFYTEERTLKAFCRAMGDIAMTEVQRDRVDAYLAGKGAVTRFWERKHEVLVGFTVSPSHGGTPSMSHCPTGCLNQLRPLCPTSTRTTSCGAC
jgi:hypothetical protein